MTSEVWLAGKLLGLEKTKIRAGTFCLALGLPALMAGGSLHPAASDPHFFKHLWALPAPLPSPGPSSSWHFKCPKLYQQVQGAVLRVTDLVYLEMAKPDESDVVSLANTSHISAVTRGAMNQVVPTGRRTVCSAGTVKDHLSPF